MQIQTGAKEHELPQDKIFGRFRRSKERKIHTCSWWKEFWAFFQAQSDQRFMVVEVVWLACLIRIIWVGCLISVRVIAAERYRSRGRSHGGELAVLL